MKGIRAKLIFWVCALATLIHFAALFILKFNLNEKAWLYVYPYFDQQWSLFAPPPQQNVKVLLVLENDSCIWLNSSGEKHALSGELEKQALNNSVHYLLNAPPENPEKMRHNHNFLLLEKFVQSYLKHEQLPKAKKIGFVLCNASEQKVIAVYNN